MKKLTKVLILAMVFVMLFGTVFSSAAEPYDTYTYSIDGETLKSPPAFSAVDDFDAIDMKIKELDPAKGNFGGKLSDITTDNDGNVYISDTANNRVVVLNKHYEAIHIISEYEYLGQKKTLVAPEGIFVSDPEISVDGSSYIYICNRAKNSKGDDVGEVVIFDRNYNYVDTVVKPESDILKDSDFMPHAVAVDKYGRMFIVSQSAKEGVVCLSASGDFTGFIGVQKVTLSVLEQIWRKFMSTETMDKQAVNSHKPYNNIAVDDEGFVYVTIEYKEAADIKKQFASIKNKSAAASPVKKLNAQGDEIMDRLGFFDPGGEVVINMEDISTITDVVVGAEGTWTILDTNSSSNAAKQKGRFFTYDQSGNLLFAFGASGDQLGQGSTLSGITYHVFENEGKDTETTRFISMDARGTITVYEPTDYYYAIINALKAESGNNYAESRVAWENVLSYNNNFDLAYIGIGKALYNQGDYAGAMEYLEKSYETKIWSKASAAAGDQMMKVWLFPVIIAVIAVVVLFFKFLGYAKKRNKETSIKVGPRSFVEELLFAFHLVFHPFDGFWDLKHEKRGSVRAGTVILVLTGLSLFYQSIGRGYPFNPRGETMNIFLIFGILALVFFLFCISNWCLTTLFEGEGSFKDIYIAATYSLAPLPLFLIISTVMTNVLNIDAQSIISLISSIGYIWVGILLFFGMMVTHDYSMGKNFITILGTILAMLIIAFISVLFISLVAKIIGFVVAIVAEIGNRM